MMSDMETNTVDMASDSPDAPEAPESDRRHVAKILAAIKEDKKFHDKAFKRMRRDMFMAHHGYDEKEWDESLYKANIAGRHVKTKTSALYAKNPKAVARRAPRIDFEVWDENPQSLLMAFQTMQTAIVAGQQAQAMPMQTEMGAVVPAPVQMPPGYEYAQSVIADYQAGMEYRKMADRVGKTLEILFAYMLREQQPLDFKTSAKQLVRRTCTCGVGYVELGFQRQFGPRAGLDAQMSDARARLDHLQRLAAEIAEGEIDEGAAEISELQKSIESLAAEPEIVLREGLTFDFPASTKVIPDKLTTSLVGFIGARHVTIEYLFTIEQVQEMFPEADFKSKGYKGYNSDGSLADGPEQGEIPFDDEIDQPPSSESQGRGMVCVYKHYDKLTGLVYYVADGHPAFLRAPAAPDVFVEQFWPIYALTFNAVESETELFPKSDVALLADQQMEHNRSRQGMREHRKAARPRYATTAGILDEEGIKQLRKAEAFDVSVFNKDPQTKLADVLEVIPVPGVDPNLYQTEQFEQDRQLTVGTSEAAYGGISKATATESAISANSMKSGDDSSIDDLDSFLSFLARDSGNILLHEMSEEQVKKIVGRGALWPTMTLPEIAAEIFLEVEAGSSGKPNQAVEIDNYVKLAPILQQIPQIDPVWLAKEGVKRMNDRMDINEAIMSNMPSIVAQNAMASAAPTPPAGPAGADPNQQGGEGAQNAPQPPGVESPGSEPAFGSNQVV